WRSHPHLLAGLNVVFAASGWFDGDITYRPVTAPAACRAQLYHDQTGRAPITMVDLPDVSAGGAAQTTFARFVAAEVQHLLSPGPGGKPRLLLNRRGQVEA